MTITIVVGNWTYTRVMGWRDVLLVLAIFLRCV
jgi:hypothetical protein